MNYDNLDIKEIIAASLKEDIGKADITTEAFIPARKSIKAVILAKEPCVVCGLNVVALVFMIQDKSIKFKPLVAEGAFVKRGEAIASISGNARAILSAERVALNFLSHLCGISTETRKFVNAVKPYRILAGGMIL